MNMGDYQAFIQRYKAAGKPLAAYNCPVCDFQIETPKPKPGDVYDSLTLCPECDRVHYKVVNSDGQVSAQPMYGGAA